MSEKLTLREAKIDDAGLMFSWRSDPETRKMSRDTSEVALENHMAWLSQRLSLSAPGIYIAEIGETPVGTVRIDGDEISYTVAPEQRRKGIGELMLAVAKEMFGPKIAEIKRENTASAKVAERAGHVVRFID